MKNEKKHGFHKNIHLYLFIFENEFLETSHVTRTVPMKFVCITLVLWKKSTKILNFRIRVVSNISCIILWSDLFLSKISAKKSWRVYSRLENLEVNLCDIFLSYSQNLIYSLSILKKNNWLFVRKPCFFSFFNCGLP